MVMWEQPWPHNIVWGIILRLVSLEKRIGASCSRDGQWTTLTQAESQDVLEIVDDRYQAKGIAMAGPVALIQWHALFPDPTLAETICDGLIHGPHRGSMQGGSMRTVLSSPAERDTTNVTE
ncbi:ATP-binding protein [Sulfobacillus thermosulfidooxidans]|uniref:ATP-binding protein n=1 Tax=Sulfobacillus thermosulfidooxidans TaxID=28034 RepID=UPI0006B63462|nr:ATP-binding protein [Sulfobacillus thermosulfidooxidans]